MLPSVPSLAVDKTSSALVAAASVSASDFDLDVGWDIDTSSEFACETASTEAYASVDADSFYLGPLALAATSESFGSEETGAPSSG